MAVSSVSMIASRGFSRRGSSTVSTRTSFLPFQHTARIQMLCGMPRRARRTITNNNLEEAFCNQVLTVSEKTLFLACDDAAAGSIVRRMQSDDPARSMAAVLEPAQLRVLEAVAERIFPATDTPGATAIGAVEYIVRALAGDYPEEIPIYERGLGEIDRHALKRFGKNFTELEESHRDAVLDRKSTRLNSS